MKNKKVLCIVATWSNGTKVPSFIKLLADFREKIREKIEPDEHLRTETLLWLNLISSEVDNVWKCFSWWSLIEKFNLIQTCGPGYRLIPTGYTTNVIFLPAEIKTKDPGCIYEEDSMSSAENLSFKHWKDKPVTFKIKGCLSACDQISFCCQIDFTLQLSANNEKRSIVNILFKFSLLNESNISKNPH